MAMTATRMTARVKTITSLRNLRVLRPRKTLFIQPLFVSSKNCAPASSRPGERPKPNVVETLFGRVPHQMDVPSPILVLRPDCSPIHNPEVGPLSSIRHCPSRPDKQSTCGVYSWRTRHNATLITSTRRRFDRQAEIVEGGPSALSKSDPGLLSKSDPPKRGGNLPLARGKGSRQRGKGTPAWQHVWWIQGTCAPSARMKSLCSFSCPWARLVLCVGHSIRAQVGHSS